MTQLARSAALLVLLTAIAAGSFAADPPKKQDARNAKAIRAVLDAQVEAWNKGDLEGFMKGYWKSEELTFFSGKDRRQGWKETLERYRKRYQGEGKEMGKLRFTELDVQPLGPKHALVRGRWEVTTSKEKLGGLFTLILRETEDGWRIVHDHTSG